MRGQSLPRPCGAWLPGSGGVFAQVGTKVTCLQPYLSGLPSLQEIDEYITQARDKSYETMMRVGKRGLNLAANAAVTAAAKVRQGWVQTRRGSRPVHPGSCPGPWASTLSVFRPWRLWAVQLEAPASSPLLSGQFPPLAKGRNNPNTMVTSVSTPPALPLALLVRGGNPRARGCCRKSSGASACRT